MNKDVWGLFHDGTIESISGTVPGNISLSISIQYLRKMFPGDGENFTLMLNGCSKFYFTPYGESPIDCLAEIVKNEPEILYVKSVDPLVLDCANGIIDVQYDDCEISLNSGETVTYESLVDAAKKYWADWERRGRARAKPTG